MSNSIPLNIGTLKDRKSRQEQADADLKLQILNSNRLARASRDYWINNEEPINSQPDYTTNEILNDKNKLLKILANDVKSMLDKEQFAIFIANNTWNNLNVLRIAVQIFPKLKRELGKNLRLLTADFLVNAIVNAVTEIGYIEQQRQQERQQNENENENQNENRRNDNPAEEDYYDFGEQNNNGRNEMPARPRVPDGYYENALGEWERIPEGYYRNPDGGWERVPEGYYRNADENIVRRPKPMLGNDEDNYEERSRNNKPATRFSDVTSRADYMATDEDRLGPGNMSRQNSDLISEISEPEFSTLVPSVEREANQPPKQIDLKILKDKIDQLNELDEDQIIPIISKMINIKQNGAYSNDRVLKSKATREANKLLREKYLKAGVFDRDVEDRIRSKNRISQSVAGDLIADVYQNTEYDFPEPTKTGPVFQKKGYGLPVKLKKGAKYGRGMAVQMKGVSAPVKLDRSELYYSFGVFAVHKKSLGDNILNLKYKSFSQVHKYPKRQISDDLKDILVDAIETKKINNKLFNALTDSDKSFLTELVNEAKLRETFPNIFKSGNGIAINEPALERWEIVKGEFLAGNSNAEIKKEMRVLINQFMKQKLISAQEGFGILEML